MTDAPTAKHPMKPEGHCAHCGGLLPEDLAVAICPRCELGGALNLSGIFSSPWDGTIKLWSAATRHELGSLEAAGASYISFSLYANSGRLLRRRLTPPVASDRPSIRGKR